MIDKKDNSVYTLSCKIRFLISITYLFSIFFSYMLMLIVMTYNAGLFIVTVLGLTTGYFIFGFIRNVLPVIVRHEDIKLFCLFGS